MACFRVDVPTYVVTDAFPVGLGAILLQYQDIGERKPIAFISRSLTSTERSLSKLLIQIQSGKWSHDLKPYDKVKEELSVLEGVVLRGNRIVVPQSLQKQILTDLVEQEVGTETKESNDSTESGATASDACDNTKPSGPVVKQATQTDEDVVTTKSGP